MPSETKKMLTKASRSGRMSPIARWLYSVSATTIPPRNAPSARERPTIDVSHAVPMHSAKMASRKTSRLRLASTQPRILGTTKRASTTVPTTTTAALPSAKPMLTAASPAGPAADSSGTMSTIGTTHRSWKMSVPTMNLP
ncbi:MAG: hypothetical protein K0R38_1623 [Polyangiaceae bacterium]|nr:hypothetical protein [Polyangiaceae bacterium]